MLIEDFIFDNEGKLSKSFRNYARIGPRVGREWKHIKGTSRSSLAIRIYRITQKVIESFSMVYSISKLENSNNVILYNNF